MNPPDPCHVLAGPTGLRVELAELGAAIRSLRVPVPGGAIDAVLGYARPEDYRTDPYFMGAMVGRYANRIEDGQLHLDGRTYALATSQAAGGHCLHGGPDGFYRRRWRADPAADGQSVRFVLHSPDGDQGFPGDLHASVTYRLLDDSSLSITTHATCQATTVVSLASHPYFNLEGKPGDVLDHRLRVNADRFTPLKPNQCPIGTIENVDGTPFDLREGPRLRGVLGQSHPQLRICAGLDHNFVLSGNSHESRLAAVLEAPGSGLRLEVMTSLPCLQVYTGNQLVGPFSRHQGICLEAQHCPNAPNIPGFSSAVLRPGDEYRERVIYRFSGP